MKRTWKEATLDCIKTLVDKNPTPIDKKNHNVFSIKQLMPMAPDILTETRSRSKYPERTIDKTLRELKDFNVLKHRKDIGARVYEYIPNHDNEELIYKEKRSIGHIRVTKCLDNLGIKYEEEKTFHDLKKISYLRLDIYCKILKKKYAIEYDGIQHQKTVDIWGGEQSLSDCQERDLIKNRYCAEKGITLIRISHEVKDIEDYVARIVLNAAEEYAYKCLFTIIIFLYSKLKMNYFNNTKSK